MFPFFHLKKVIPSLPHLQIDLRSWNLVGRLNRDYRYAFRWFLLFRPITPPYSSKMWFFGLISSYFDPRITQVQIELGSWNLVYRLSTDSKCASWWFRGFQLFHLIAPPHNAKSCFLSIFLIFWVCSSPIPSPPPHPNWTRNLKFCQRADHQKPSRELPRSYNVISLPLSRSAIVAVRHTTGSSNNEQYLENALQ